VARRPRRPLIQLVEHSQAWAPLHGLGPDDGRRPWSRSSLRLVRASAAAVVLALRHGLSQDNGAAPFAGREAPAPLDRAAGGGGADGWRQPPLRQRSSPNDIDGGGHSLEWTLQLDGGCHQTTPIQEHGRTRGASWSREHGCQLAWATIVYSAHASDLSYSVAAF
jgi:hypothetical protein